MKVENIDFTVLSAELIRRYRVIPLKNCEGVLHLGMADPLDRETIDVIAFHTGLRIQTVLIAEAELNRFIDTHFVALSTTKRLEIELLKEIPAEKKSSGIQENVVNYEEPVIRFVDHIIQHALEQSASDIHIEPYENSCRIRYRQDGMLYEMTEIPSNLAGRLITRLKVIAKLDISERRLPQDGRFQLTQSDQRIVDIRINTCPTLFGEKIVLRLLDMAKIAFDIDALELSKLQKKIFLEKISRPQGLILVTGPTGSGKTVTLYSALRYLNTPEKNISTVEDPVEIQLQGINQVHVNPKIGLQFSTVLRTFLRQDPDIIMVGEIRDKETAEIAIQAAQTGHLVLSTLHTNSAQEAVARLQSMGVPLYNINSAITLVIAQRLIRKLCLHCRERENENLYRAKGCSQCLQGYQGRMGIYEFLMLEEKTTEKNSLRQAGLDKVTRGITSLTEINRVIPE